MPTPRWSFLSSAEYNPQTAVHSAEGECLCTYGMYSSSCSAAEEVGGQRAIGGGVRAAACVRNET